MAGNLEGNLNFAGNGELAGSATAAQMPSRACVGVMFKAASDNAGSVFIGGPGVTAAAGTTTATGGWELAAGEATPFLPCVNMDQFYRICDNAGDDLFYMIWQH